jgi:transcriptional/translational regulatory protein YebC/TACO1
MTHIGSAIAHQTTICLKNHDAKAASALPSPIICGLMDFYGTSMAACQARGGITKERPESVSRDVIERAIKKGAGLGGEKLVMEHVVFEGYAPHKVPVIVEVFTDNTNRTAPEFRVLFKRGQLGGSIKFLFDHVGLVEGYHQNSATDIEGAAIEAGANEVEPLSHETNDDIPEGTAGARFITERNAVHAVSKWLTQNGWTVVTSEFGYIPKNCPELTEPQRAEVGEFLQELEDHDDTHRVWAAVK